MKMMQLWPWEQGQHMALFGGGEWGTCPRSGLSGWTNSQAQLWEDTLKLLHLHEYLNPHPAQCLQSPEINGWILDRGGRQVHF